MSPDLVNAAFEALGGVFVAASVRRLYLDKRIAGVSWAHVLFVTAWGYWNLWYYPHLGQWASFWGGAGVVAANTAWFVQIVYYNLRSKT